MNGGACGLMDIIAGNEETVQNLDEAPCISHSANTFGKGINLIIFPPAMDKL